MRVRGYGTVPSLLLVLPRITLVRAYRHVARRVNRVLFDAANRRRLRRIGNAADGPGGDTFYVIVMPGTLHFLLPCLALLPDGLRVVLLGNGAAAWERRRVAQRFPAFRYCALAMLPGTSLVHGDVITLLLESNTANFGLLDHDCYVFDPRIFASLSTGPKDCMTAIYGGVSAKTGYAYPETYLMFLHAAALKDTMARYHVDARICHEAPEALRPLLSRVGLGEGVFVKDDRAFFDTLHLLLALAVVDGYACRFLQQFDREAISHVGGTSWKTAETKELIDCYVDWCFLDLDDSAELRRRYRHRTQPFRSAARVRAAIPMTPEAFARVAWIDALVARLAATDVPARNAEAGSVVPDRRR
jgi:hypothetical protein